LTYIRLMGGGENAVMIAAEKSKQKEKQAKEKKTCSKYGVNGKKGIINLQTLWMTQARKGKEK